jgi:hypothetical protein
VTYFANLVQDENDPKEDARLLAFLKEYKALCDKHRCCIAADATSVLAVSMKDEQMDYWGVHLTTAYHRKKARKQIRKLFAVPKKDFRRQLKYEALPD